MSSFWTPKGKVPVVQGYNEGIEMSKVVVRDLGRLGLGWVVVGGVWLLWYEIFYQRWIGFRG